MFVQRPRSFDEEFAGMDTFHLLQPGHASTSGDELSDAEWKQHRKECREAAARRRPCGFAPWPEEETP